VNLFSGVVNAISNVVCHCDICIVGCRHWHAKRNALQLS